MEFGWLPIVPEECEGLDNEVLVSLMILMLMLVVACMGLVI